MKTTPEKLNEAQEQYQVAIRKVARLEDAKASEQEIADAKTHMYDLAEAVSHYGDFYDYDVAPAPRTEGVAVSGVNMYITDNCGEVYASAELDKEAAAEIVAALTATFSL